MKFRPKNDQELENVSEDERVAYLVQARNAGFDQEVLRGIGFLIYPRYKKEISLIRKRVKSEHDAEEILGDVMADLLKAAFRGEHTGEFFALFYTIRDRRIADYYKKIERTPEMAHPSATEDGGDFIDSLAPVDDFTGESEAWMVIEDVLATHSERDRMVIRLRIDGHPARQVADTVNDADLDGGAVMTPANVDQIYTRFRNRLRPGLLAEGGRADE